MDWLEVCDDVSRFSTRAWTAPVCDTTTDILTGPSRCFPFWQEVLACYVVNTNSEDDSGKKKCVPVLEDYYECLHHRKEVQPLLRTPLASPSRYKS